MIKEKRGRQPVHEDEGQTFKAMIPASLYERLKRYLNSGQARNGESMNSMVIEGIEMRLKQLEEEREK